MALNLNQLRVFRAILESTSITAAARALRISQPAASKQLAELEASLGVTLVERRAKGLRLTSAGEVLSRHTWRLFQEEEAAERALSALLGLELGQLAVGASTTIGNYIVPRLFGELHRSHPRVELELEIGNTAHIREQLLEGRLDLGLTEGLVATEGSDLDSLHVEVFSEDEMLLIIAPAHPFAQSSAGSIDPRQLAGLPFILRERGSGTRDVTEDAFDRHGIRLTPTMTLGSTEAVKNAVVAGLGAAFVSRLTVELELSSGRLRALPLQDFSIRRALSLLTPEGKPPSPAAGEFLRLLREHYPGLAPAP
ncbi:MAG TPA: LysR family transcriptional regulator [Polyangiaceae bacterium]|nr:LysR family transcriptional regulator [Polyangiaceae bacterium]